MEGQSTELPDKYVHLIGRAKIEIVNADGIPIDQTKAPEKIRVTLLGSDDATFPGTQPITFEGGLLFETMHLIAEFKKAGVTYDETLSNAKFSLVRFDKAKNQDIGCMNTIDPPCNTVAG